MKPDKILIVAGGTGGHIFPALVFGRWVESQNKAARVFYLSGSRALEIEIYKAQGVEALQLPLSGSPLGSPSVAEFFRRCAGLVRAFFRTGAMLRRERPAACFLFGGYVSLAPLVWCRFLGIPAIMHEQNACAGKVTRLAARMGLKVASGWKECRGIKHSVCVGIPVRPLKKISKRDAANSLGLKIEEKDWIVGVVGGSLGSSSLAALLAKKAEAQQQDTPFSKARRPVFVVLGEGGQVDSSIRFVGRRWDMTPFYSLVDAVICRAGASTLAELATYGIPALAVPWMKAADGHQEANARSFASLTGCPVWIEGKEGVLEEAFSELLDFAQSKEAENNRLEEGDAPSQALWCLAFETNF